MNFLKNRLHGVQAIVWAGIVVFPAACGAAPLLVATNLPGVMAYAAPPAGFEPLTATDDDLATHGFPARPASFGTGRDAERWQHMARAARHWVMPVLQETRMAAGPPRQRLLAPPRAAGSAAAYTSKNWSAQIILNHANGYATGAFTSAVGWFNVPAASQAFGACTGNWDSVFTWVGIDGWTSNQVFQAGTESDAYCSAGSTYQYYSAWYEWFPDYATRITSLAINPGDVVGIWMIADSATTGRAFVIDGTTTHYAIISFTAPAGITLKGDSAEWVEERPSYYGVLSTLTNFVEAWISDESATELNTYGGFNPGSPPYGGSSLNVTMLDDSGQAIAYPAALGTAATEFKTEGSAY